MDSDDDLIELCSWTNKPPSSSRAKPSSSKTMPSGSRSNFSLGSKKPAVKKQTTWVASSFDGFDDFGQNLAASQPTSKAGRVGTKGQKRPRDAGLASHSQAGGRSSPLAEDELWPDRHTPKTVADLAVHKKKVEEFQGWLEDCLRNSQRQSSVVLLTGPAGCGKTATVHAVAAEVGVEVQEWINPVSSSSSTSWSDNWSAASGDFTPRGYGGGDSQVTLFQDFLLRANKYPSLQIFQQDQLRQKLILVEDFPNAFFKDAPRLHSILRSYRQKGRCPLIFIISDTGGGGDSCERLLFPKDFQAEVCMANISFNPVAQTSMTKVLTRIASVEASNKSRYKISVPSKATIDELSAASSGDVRAAINALQFACLRGISHADAFAAIASNSKPASKKRGASSTKTSTGLKSRFRKQGSKAEAKGSGLAAIGGRDTSLFLFRALGRVLYCKRGDPAEFPDQPMLPSHLKRHDRDPLLVNPEDVLDKCHLSGEFFTAFLHQNYLEFYPNIEDLVEATAYLSDADYLTTEWATRQTMRDYSACVASRGLMFCNSARARHSAGGGSGLGWKPLHKPQWYATVRKMKDNCLTARELFKGHCQSPVELQTQLLPYLYIINVPLRNQAQAAFLPEVARISTRSGGRLYQERLDEKDVSSLAQIDDEDPGGLPAFTVPVDSQTDSQGMITGSQGQVQAATETQDDEEDEVVIEDFDDEDIW